MMSPSKVLEREIGKLIKASPDLISLFGKPEVPIYTMPQETNLLPYLVYCETITNERGADDISGCEHLVDIELRSGTESESLAKDILDAVRTAIDRKEKYMEFHPYTILNIDYVSQDIARDTDGQVIRVTARYRALTGGRRL